VFMAPAGEWIDARRNKARENNALINGPHAAALQPEKNVTDNPLGE